jgi:hypothetical protein
MESRDGVDPGSSPKAQGNSEVREFEAKIFKSLSKLGDFRPNQAHFICTSISKKIVLL